MLGNTGVSRVGTSMSPWLKIDSLDKMKIKSSGSKEKMKKPGNGLITSLGFKAKVMPQKYKKARYAIGNVSKKEISKIIREFEKLPFESYERKRTKHEPTDSYFYLARQLAKCMMRVDALNSDNYPVRTEMTARKQILTSHLCSTEESELKEFLIEKTLLQICSKDKE